MAEIVGRPSVALIVRFEITEAEARALDALVGYGDEAFLKAFKNLLGKSYMEGNEQGLTDFFKSIREKLPHLLRQTDKARKVFNSE